MDDYRKCFKPDCMRKVSPVSRYCCHSCTVAAEAAAPYEIEPYDPAVHWLRGEPPRSAPFNVAVRYEDDGSAAVVPFHRRLRLVKE